ncbi:acylphosphatase [Sneathiella chinensis]|uniref:acylphosphatase n=1 Tax=Sneathiella chinensis TaxID=349750 RepID=A0ABQ5U7N2_9PROT|nr:acylphosphatase [Sneathiella chinensis]GLQ07745.1 acylphosphatase [Sneathiella chinensis]
MKTVHARISGKVQGVWYRAWTVEQAKTHGIRGWVRNRTDGTVEALFQGDGQTVLALLEKCKDGPPMAKVTDISTEDVVEASVYLDFTAESTL